MSFIDILADVSGVVKQLKRIADALDRISPIPKEQPARAAVHASERGQGAEQAFHLAESPEEYQARLNHEFDLAISLGVAPWSPAFQQALSEMKSDIMKPRIEKVRNDEGAEVEIERVYSEAEAEQILRESFRLAQASATLSKTE